MRETVELIQESDISFFDANCMVGKWPDYFEGSFYSPEDLIKEMHYCAIDDALVYHSLSKYYEPATGNREILESVKRHPMLHPSWVLLPSQTSEMLQPDDIAREMVDNNVHAARLFPRLHNFLLEQSLYDLLAVLTNHRIPLFIDCGNLHWSEKCIPWAEIRRVCENFPELPVVLIRIGIGDNRMLYPLLEAAQNLYIEISYYQTHDGLEQICKRFGPERLLFGSDMPIFAPGPPVTMVMHADVPKETKRLIAGDNLRNLLGNVKSFN